MKDVLRKSFALLLCLTMVLSLFPTAFAEDGIELAGDDALGVPEIEEVAGDEPIDPGDADPTANKTAETNPSDSSVGDGVLDVPETSDEPEAPDELAKDNIPNDADEAEILIPGSIRDDDTFEAVSASGSWGNLTWTLDSSGTLTISGSRPMKDFSTNSTDAWRSYGNAIKTVVINPGVTSIGEWAFYDCSSLTSVSIPGSVNSIGKYAFYYCTSLTSVTIPDGVISIGDFAFSGCSGLTDVSIGDDVNSIGEWAFYDCSSLTSVSIGDGVTTIGNYAFQDCYGLTSVTIPDSVTTIGNQAFFGCYGLTSVTIPERVTSIGDYAFWGCNRLTCVLINSLDAWCDISFGSYDSNPLYYAHNLVLNGVLVKNLAIPEGRLTIKDCTFSGCSSLTSVTIPEGVTSIGNYAFYNCSSLTSVTILEGVNSIGDCAFEQNGNLQMIVFPGTLERIGSSAFQGCNKLSDIYYNGNDQDWDQVSKDDAFLQGEIHYKTDPIVIEQHFPDPVFQEYIRRFDVEKNGTLSEWERAGVRTIDVSRLGIGA